MLKLLNQELSLFIIKSNKISIIKFIMSSIEIDNYINSFPEATKTLLEQLRSIIKQTAPGAEEDISYKMPAYKYHGILVYFAGYKNHIGFYPTASGIKYFQNEIKEYKNSTGAIQFPLNKPINAELVKNIVKFKMNENLQKEKLRKKVQKD